MRPRPATFWARRCCRCWLDKRYSHIAALRGDGVLPELLGMRKIVSEDSVRRAFAAIEEEAGAAWMRRHLDYCLEPLLSEPWILDIDTTVKPLYGHQEGAVVGYNPKKPGRPSHCYHTYSMAGTRLGAIQSDAITLLLFVIRLAGSDLRPLRESRVC